MPGADGDEPRAAVGGANDRLRCTAMSNGFDDAVAKIRANSRPGALVWSIRSPSGDQAQFGSGEPAFEVVVRSEAGLAAVQSLNELAIAEAYMRDDLDFEGDFFRIMELRYLLQERNWAITAWAQVQPLLVGRNRLNPKWIAKHYDTKNVQTLALDRNFSVYTPGIYDGDDDTLEAGAERKLESAFSSLRLKAGDSLLDVGCGWGGFTRYCARRGVEVTGITLSRHQLEFTRARLAEDGLTATVEYQDFFTFAPGRRFDAISMMGVWEDLSDYDKTMKHLTRLLTPGGRVYSDFAATKQRFGIASTITKHVWPGLFRMVYMPQFTKAVADNYFEMVTLDNDRHNYHLWCAKVHERWLARHDDVLQVVDEATWRLHRLVQAGGVYCMGPHATDDTAYRVVLARRNPRVGEPSG
ncbi:MAG: cyclopropane-fatty-acyl-phospholipid synthase [Acidimicrobiaceae bacterium]